MNIKRFQEVFPYYLSFANLEKSPVLYSARTYKLDRMYELLEQCGNPQQSVEVLHIAGTKGKGSTAAFLASILNAAGHRTGLYASPHVSSFLERISVLKHPADQELFIRLTNQIKQLLEKQGVKPVPNTESEAPTTFELLTLLAFLYFRETSCRYAVLETGIGGRLDATNVVNPLCCLITPIELEHTELLGDTLELIAQEKGGIIKPGVPVFSSAQEPPVREVLTRISRERGSEILFLDEAADILESRLHTTRTELHLRLKGEAEHRFRLSLLGDFQAENAALAYLALSRQFTFSKEIFRLGIGEATIPGRMELVSTKPPVVLDGAHTPRSIRRVLKVFEQLFGRRGVLLFGAVTGKKVREMAELLAPAFAHIIITTPGAFKESDPEQTYRIFSRLNAGTRLVKSPQKAVKQALALTGGRDPLLITGSFYLLGETRDFWIPK